MKLQDRNLNIRMRGKDVELLQQELRQLDFAIEDEAGYFGSSTRRAVEQFQEENNREMTGVVDEPTAKLINEAVQALGPEPGGDDEVSSFVVRGHVRKADGSPLIRAIVRASDKDLRHEERLGEAVTDGSGCYEIAYTTAQFRRAEKKRADLIVRLFDQEDQELIASDILFNAQTEETVNLMIGGGEYRGPSEYEQLLEELVPVLGDVPPAELNDEDISFLAAETGQEQIRITYLAAAHRLTNQTDLQPAVFYGTFRQGLSTELLLWLTSSLLTIRNALEKSIKEKIIPAGLASDLDSIIESIQDISIEQPTFLAKPENFFKPLGSLSDLTPSQTDFIASKLNTKLRSEVLNTLGEVSRDLRKKAMAIANNIEYQEHAKTDLASIVKEKILSEIKRDTSLVEEANSIESRINQSSSPTVAAVLGLDQPLADNAIFDTETRFARTLEYARLAELEEEIAKQLFESDVLLDDVDQTALTELVKEKVLSEKQRVELLAVHDFGKLTGDNFTMIEALRNGQCNSVGDYFDWQAADWQQLITREAMPVPLGETAGSYAQNIQANIEKAYPSQTLLSRLTNNKQRNQLSNLDTAKDLLRNNKQLIGDKEYVELDWRGISADRREKIETSVKKLRTFANTYRHLGAMELINDNNLDIHQKKNTISTRLQWLKSFYDNNKNLDLRFVNLVDKSDTTLNWSQIPSEGQAMIRNQLKAYQRVLNLGVDTADRQLLLSKGFDSAIVIVGKTETDFLTSSGLPLGTARMVYSEAQESALSVSHQLGSIRDLVHGNFKDIAMANIDPKMINDLRDIDGYDDLFGSQDFCECRACSSILGPAAYFVDLMYFIEQNVSKPVFVNTKKTDHPLYLKNRRQDLWTLVLSCENTDTWLPYLTIVNEVLETYLNTLVGSDIYQKLSNKSEKISFGLPVNLALEELRLYLSHFKITPFDIYRLRREPETKVWRARVNLSQDEYDVITTSDAAGVNHRIGNPATLADFPVQDFIRLAGITRQQLDELLELRYNADLQNLQVKKKTSPDKLQNFPEILKNLTNNRLDFIHRFIRLWKKTSWIIPELDLILSALKQSGLIGPDVNANAVRYLAQLIDIQAKLSLSVEELCSFADQLPVSKDYPKPPAKQAVRKLYERLFDLKQLFGESNSTTHQLNETVTFYYYRQNTVNTNDKQIDSKTPLLIAGLGITETELSLLFDHLKTDLVFNNKGNMDLDREKVSLLFRHVRLAKALLLSIDDLITASQLLFAPGNSTITTFKQIFELYKFAQSLKSSPFSVPELCFILEGEECGAVKYQTSVKAVGKIVQAIQKSQPGNDIVALKTELTKYFNLTAQTLDDSLKWASTDINSNPVKDALKATFTNDVPDNPAKLKGLSELMKQLERVALLFSKLKFKPKTIAYLSSKTAALGITNPKQLSYANIKSLVFYQTQSTLGEDAEPLVQAILDSYLSTQAFSVTNRERLVELWQQDNSLVESLVSLVSPPGVAIEVLEYLWDHLAICRTLGINAYSLLKLGKDASYDEIDKAKDVALGAFSSKYDDEKVRKDKLEPYQDQVNVIKRDALCDYIIARKKDLKFQDYRDIYAFFLLDVEMSGCFRTSRVQCAIASLQLYVHRCLINLEQSDPVLNPSIPNISVAPSLIPTYEWDWRKNYRVWEANRKVFLYPESYIEPDLRDNKTPIFKELEDELLQEKITKESAQLAYKKYVSQFAELAHLRITGSYYHKDTNSYYFFGRNQQDPPQYYYRKWVDHKVWTPWEKIELTIASDHVSAILHQGRLYLFWTDMKTREETKIKKGNATREKVHHNLNLNYSYMDEKGQWISPQNIHFFLRTFGSEYSFSNACFPSLYKQKIYIFYGDKTLYQTYGFDPIADYNMGVLSAQLSLFQNILTLPGFLPDIYWDNIEIWLDLNPPYELLIPSNSNLLNLYIENYDNSKKSDPSFSAKSALIVYQNKSPIHEAELNDSLIVSGSSGSKVTNLFNAREIDPALQIVGGKPDSLIFKVGNQQYLIEGQQELGQALDTPVSKTAGLYYLFLLSNRFMYRLSTSVADELGEELFSKGLETFLAPKTQKKYKEHPVGIKFPNPSELMGPYDDPNHIDFTGAFGLYYKELYFHIPFLIASHLNANQKFKEAKWWYERIFDPTANDPDTKSSSKDNNWRYLEFRGISIQKMKDILTDKETIAQYKKDPFNPHAIARLRLSAYQKSIVMKYIDNLLDWGDHLFAQDKRESINEATMLYVLAADILGRRPAKLGSCKTAQESNLTYSNIGPDIKDSEFLINLENWNVTAYMDSSGQKLNSALVAGGGLLFSGAAITAAGATGSPSTGAGAVAGAGAVPVGAVMAATDTVPYSGLDIVEVSAKVSDKNLMPYKQLVEWQAKKADTVKMWETHGPVKSYPGISIAKQSALAFCVPPNKELLKYWDRVEDRLYKIRYCMNISGVRRSLALFEPPISPMALVRAKAAGLSLEDILGQLSVTLSPYRFSYLIEKAKQLTQTVQTFGNALLNALEKKDVEELNLLRSVHERNIFRMTKEVKKQQIKDAKYQYRAQLEAKTNVQNRINYYQGLISSGLSEWETTQQIFKHVSAGFLIGETVLRLTSGISYLVPQLGSPFAMTYGGREIGDSQLAFSELMGSLAKIFDSVSASAGLEATFQRREQEWQQQLRLAKRELKQIEQQCLAAEVRQTISEKELDIHDKNMTQADELYKFYKNKFSNLGLYTYLSTNLNRLYREAYNVAYDLATLAERAYKFERDDNSTYIAGDNWQYDRAGLLAGERLLLQLQQMESSYLKEHTRNEEVTQSISLAMVDPNALLTLRQTGKCEFTIPEIVFDLAYPGHYKRLIKSVRVSMPSVAGPYSNVSARLTLKESKVRKTSTTNLVDVPYHKLTSIATSHANNDSGLFELNFRDERYLPFEGAGAVNSKWQLELPSKIRLFDYDTISDVIIHIGYTAKYDGVLKNTVEGQIATTLKNFASSHGLYRLFSLRHEFPNAYHKLFHPAAGSAQTTKFDVTQKYFPFFLGEETLTLSAVTVYIQPKGNDVADTANLTLKINNNEFKTWDLLVGKMKGETGKMSGNVVKKWTLDTGVGGLNKDKIDDIFLLLNYKI